jgi:hypothetical protein
MLRIVSISWHVRKMVTSLPLKDRDESSTVLWLIERDGIDGRSSIPTRSGIPQDARNGDEIVAALQGTLSSSPHW